MGGDRVQLVYLILSSIIVGERQLDALWDSAGHAEVRMVEGPVTTSEWKGGGDGRTCIGCCPEAYPLSQAPV